MKEKNVHLQIRRNDVKWKKLLCFFIIGFLLFLGTGNRLGRKNDKDETNIRIPYILSQILFPFKKNTKVRVTLCSISGYIEASNIIIYGSAIFLKGNLDWLDINAMWLVLFVAVCCITQPYECIKDTIYKGKDRNLLYNILSWLGCIFIVIFSIGCTAFAVYYVIDWLVH